MYLIYLFLTLALIVVNLAGMTAAISRWLPIHASARLLAVFTLCLLMFALEHIHGLGKLIWVWPLSTLAALWCINRYHTRDFWIGELIFAVGVGYGLLWRYAFPNIDAGSEHLTDLYFIANFFDGPTLPASDHWLAGGVFDFYYALQHYAAALLGRVFNLPVGLSMNLAWAILMGFMVSLGWEIAGNFVKSHALKALLVGALVIGGNGLSPLVPWMIDSGDNPPDAVMRVWANTRFHGAYDQNVNTTFGRIIADGDPSQSGFETHLELPLETIAYYSVLGDYHPPLGGFVIALWTLALSAFLGMRRTAEITPSANFTERWLQPERLAFFGLAMTPALILAGNAWVFPLQCLLLASWLLLRHLKSNLDWPALLAGGLLSMALIYPFFSYFGPSSLKTPILPVAAGLHSPLKLLLAMHWPLLIWLGGAALLLKKSPWTAAVAFTVLVTFLLSELVFVDDPMSGKYERFNTTLKWWSWLWPVSVIGLGSAVIGLGDKVSRTLGLITLAGLLSYGLDLGRYWWTQDKPQKGQLAGDGWLKQNSASKDMLAYLRQSPPGNVLESIEQGAYSNATALSLFAGKPLVLGWPDHESQWRGAPAFISHRADEIRRFYHGEIPDPLELLNKYQVQTVVWTLDDDQRHPNLWARLNEQLASRYHWRSFSLSGGHAVGLWERQSANRQP